jgi:hypothetical protein
MYVPRSLLKPESGNPPGDAVTGDVADFPVPACTVQFLPARSVVLCYIVPLGL